MAPILHYPSIEILPPPAQRWLGKEVARQLRHKQWYPQTQSQFDALECRADILLLSGSAGSLKTSTMLMEGVQYRESPKMNTYFFRRTYPAMEDAMRQAHEMFPQMGFRSVDSHGGFTRTWRTPAGGTFAFRQLMNKKDLDNNWGKEISCALFDEASQWEEEYIRVILTRNRSSDPDMSIRARLGTNPGNIGTTWITRMFFNGVCPHCEPDKAPKPGELRWDAKWPTAGTPLSDPLTGTKMSIAYILGNIRDHDLLGNSYLAKLRMQRPTLAAALEAGCWRQFEGQYFDIWDYESMTVPDQEIPMDYWQTWWVGADYGYSGSIAAAGLYTRAPNGVIYKVAEHPGDVNDPRQNVRAFARSVYERFAKKELGQENARNVEAMYLGPDSWNNRGDDHTLAAQMNDELEPHGLEFIKANNDRAGGAQLLYGMLQNGEFKVARSCTNTITMFESRIKDEDEPVKVQKVIADPLDDVFDETRYGVYSFMEANGKPAALRIQERMKNIIGQRNASEQASMALTSAYMQHEKIRRQEDEEEKPTYLGGNLRHRLRHKDRK